MAITLPGTAGRSSPVTRSRTTDPMYGAPTAKPYVPVTAPPVVPPSSSPYVGTPSGNTNSPAPYSPDIWYGGGNNYSGGTPNTAGLDSLRRERLAAALSAIGAQYDYEEGDLEGQQASLVELFRTGMMQNERKGEITQEGVGDAAAERGLNRSGLYIKELARAMSPIADERADLVRRQNPAEGTEGRESGAAGTEVRAIESLIKLLAQQRSGATANAEIESRADELDIDTLIQMIGANLSG